MEEVINSTIPYPRNSLPDYENQYNLKELHESFLSIIVAFDEFCRKNNIMYSIADGTLLGAMRHGDFIPWDDDADLMVTRKEYNKIREALTKDDDIIIMKITFLDRVTTRECYKKKIYCDLFINDIMPSNRFLFEFKKNMTRILRCAFFNKVRNFRHDEYSKYKRMMIKIVKCIIGLLVKLLTLNKDLFELNDRIIDIKESKPSGYYTRFTSRMYETKRRFNRKSYDDGYADILLRGERVMALKNSGNFLEEMYGNYEILLAESKRKPEHSVNMLDSSEQCIKIYN